MHRSLSAALVAAILAFALGNPNLHTANAGALPEPGANSVVHAVDICVQYECYPVTIALSGAGSGRAQSTNAQFVPDGIMDCPMLRGVVTTTLCSHKYPDLAGANGVVVYLKVTPDPGSELCDETGCTTQTRTRSNFFTLAGTFTETFDILVLDIHLAKAGSGSGRITSEPSYLDCGTSCETSLEYGEKLVFTAKPDLGSRFSKWTGACAGQGAKCKITLTKSITTTAVFTALATATTKPTEPPAGPSRTPAPPTVAATVAPTVAPPTIAPTVAPTDAPSVAVAASGASDFIPIVIGIAIVLLIVIGVATEVAMRRRPSS